MDWIRLIKAILIGLLITGNLGILINVMDSDICAVIFIAECFIAIFAFIVWMAYQLLG
jgi:hypothetical protein